MITMDDLSIRVASQLSTSALTIVSTVVASYLWFCLSILKVHWNEGFSSLQHTGFKNFVRMKITKNGRLEIYAIGIDKVPTKWELDPKHEYIVKCSSGRSTSASDSDLFVGNTPEQTHKWKVPSRWKMKGEKDTPEARAMVSH